jgi:hypothetical protein
MEDRKSAQTITQNNKILMMTCLLVHAKYMAMHLILIALPHFLEILAFLVLF